MIKNNVETSILIRGWKGLARYTGYHPRTLQRWHLERCRHAFIKTHPNSKCSKWVTTPDRVILWLKALGEQLGGDARMP